MSLVTVQRNPDSSDIDKIDYEVDDEDKDLIDQLEIVDAADDDASAPAAAATGSTRSRKGTKSVSDIASVFSPGRAAKSSFPAHQYPVSSSPALGGPSAPTHLLRKATSPSGRRSAVPVVVATKAAESPKTARSTATSQSSILAIRNKLLQLNPSGGVEDVDDAMTTNGRSDEELAVRSFSHFLTPSHASSSTSHHNVTSHSHSSSSRHLIEKYFVVKDAALILPRRSSSSNLSLSLSAANTTSASTSLLPAAPPQQQQQQQQQLLLTTTASANHSLSVTQISNVGATESASGDDSKSPSRSAVNRSMILEISSLQPPQPGAAEELDADATDSTRSTPIPASLQSAGEILIHLQSMIALIRPTDTISVAVKLSSYLQDRVRYLVIVQTKSLVCLNQSCTEESSNSSEAAQCDESAILGLDLYPMDAQSGGQALPTCAVGLVLPIYANSQISLNGDGGFKFQSHQSTHIFKPVSIQAMWSAYQFLHRATENARKYHFYSTTSPVGSTDYQSLPELLLDAQRPAETAAGSNSNYQNHAWVTYYSSLIVKGGAASSSSSTSTTLASTSTGGVSTTPPNPNSGANSFINEWYQKEERSAQREDFMTPYFDGLQLCGKEQEETGMRIKEKLKEIMMRSKDDYGTMSSVHIREMLEKELRQNLDSFKKFIDVTIFQFYNQLIECATKILGYLYLGSEWNASNFDWLYEDKITHILNVSNDVDNFFPDTFKYLNIRVLDNEETDLLKEFDRTNRFIQEAKEQGTCCLVHCKMGVSRSASVVLAHLMKELNMSYEAAFNFAKQKRNCINPNEGFKKQLITYEGILNAHKAKYQLFEQTSIPPSLPLVAPSVEMAAEAVAAATMGANSPTTLSSLPASAGAPPTLELMDDQTTISVRETINKLKAISAVSSSSGEAQTGVQIISPPLSPFQPSNLRNQAGSSASSSSSSSSSSLNHSPASAKTTAAAAKSNHRLSANLPGKVASKSPSPSSNIKRTQSHLTTQQERKKLLEAADEMVVEATGSVAPVSSATGASPVVFKKANSVSFSSKLLQQYSSASNGALASAPATGTINGVSTSSAPHSQHHRSKSSSGNDTDYAAAAMNDAAGSSSLNSVKRMAEVLNSRVVQPSSPPPPPSSVPTASSTSPALAAQASAVLAAEPDAGQSSSLYVPLGTVKRQVESINFKSRPCTPQVANDDSTAASDESMALDYACLTNTAMNSQSHSELKKRQSAASLSEMPCEYANSAAPSTSISQISNAASTVAGSSKVSFYLNDTTNPLKVAGLKATPDSSTAGKDAPGDLQISTAVLTTTTTSPDSKRFKCEAGAASEATAAAETSPTATLYNRQSDFNRSKKVFEFLADKQRRQQQEEEEQQQQGQAPSTLPELEPEPIESGAAELHSRSRASFKLSQPAPTAAATTTTTTTAPPSDSVVTSSATVTLRRRSELGKCHPLSVLINKTN